MIHSLALGLLGKIFNWVFKTSKETTEDVNSDIFSAIQVLFRLGGAQLREFLYSVPIFVLFVRELVSQRKTLGAQAEMMVLGAGVAMGTLLTWVVVLTLSAASVQFLLVLSMPWLGIPLVVATSATIFAVVTFIAWMIVYALNSAFAGNPAFDEIQNRFLPEGSRQILDKVLEEIGSSGANVSALQRAALKSLCEQGENADPIQVQNKLSKVANYRFIRRLHPNSTLSDCPPSHLMLSCDKMQPVVLNEFTEVLNFHDGLNIPNAFPDWSSRHSPTLKTTSAPICPVFNAGPARSKTPPNATSMACFSVTAATWNKWLNRWRAATISAFTTC
jgi:hypothetical protein